MILVIKLSSTEALQNKWEIQHKEETQISQWAPKKRRLQLVNLMVTACTRHKTSEGHLQTFSNMIKTLWAINHSILISKGISFSRPQTNRIDKCRCKTLMGLTSAVEAGSMLTSIRMRVILAVNRRKGPTDFSFPRKIHRAILATIERITSIWVEHQIWQML